MASPNRIEAAPSHLEGAGIKDHSAAVADHAVPSLAGNQIIKEAERQGAGRADLPPLQIHNSDDHSSTAANFAKTEAVTGTAGAIGGATWTGVAMKAYGSLAELVLKPAESATLSVSNEMALDGIKFGASRGGLVGLAVGALAFGAYEVLKQSSEHPDRAPDLAALI